MNQNSIGAEAVGNAVLQTSIGSWITKISALFSSLIIFRLLDPATYGIWRIALSLTALLLGGLTALGSVIAIEAIRSMNDTEKTGLILWRGFVRVTLLIAGILLTIGIIFADRLAHLLKIQDARLIILAFFLMVFWLIKVHAFSWFSIMYQFQNQLYIQIVESLLYLA
ncbi:MAG: hypothetical protein Q8R07_01775, partial [Candidatus Uhrbacteria bacterium]|nr:hypothetical protein [Candidatus Uhrbacteria bacterium]